LNSNTDDYIGIVYIDNAKNDKDDCDNDDQRGSYNDAYGLNISNMAKAYLTYFAQYMEGISQSSYDVQKTKGDSNLIDDQFTFTLVTDVDVSGDNLLIAAFYDTLFNQICTNGWTENDKVNDEEYLQEMLKNGAMYISTLSDDGFYYQGSYSTNTYIKEVTDEEAIAQAEQKYNREKNKINYKGFLSIIEGEQVPLNLKWLNEIADKKFSKELRYEKSLHYPIEKVLICEGITEETLLPVFGKICGFDFDKNGIHVISAGGKNQVVKTFYKLSSELKIPIFSA